MTRITVAMFLGLLVGCGSESLPPASPTDAGADGNSVDDAASFGDAALFDGGVPDTGPPIGLIDGGGAFLCFNCPCDGMTHYCDVTKVGPPGPDPVDGGACTSPGRCKPYPSKCGADPSCGCIGACYCSRASTGDGLNAGCTLP